tara:strand:+ start:63 stop:743 length:681 start_codon:yes stop_codon:yes gene_type:complete
VKYFLFILLIIFSFSSLAEAFTIPKDKEVSFDVIRKKKIIGSLSTKFIKNDDKLILHSILDINVKILLFPAYKFFQETKETWIDNNLIELDGFTDFEDDREYIIKGKDTNDFFLANGMDGELKLDKNIVSLNYWNINMLNEDEVFDTQKGIVRKIKVKKLKNEVIKINNQDIETRKFIFNASKHPKDKGPFPEYILWYHDNELIKMEFKNPKDKKIIKIIRNDWGT